MCVCVCVCESAKRFTSPVRQADRQPLNPCVCVCVCVCVREREIELGGMEPTNILSSSVHSPVPACSVSLSYSGYSPI